MATYVLGDLHGFIEIYKKVKSLLQPEDKVIFVGDACDRGPESWECVKAIYNDPQFVYLKGNHEYMLCKAIKDYLDCGHWCYNTSRLCERNGGYNTLRDWEKEPNKEEWLLKLQNLSTSYAYYFNNKKYIISHAGFSPWLDENDKIEMPWEYDLVWDRDHFFDNWNDKEMADIIIVHGHTPNEYLADDLYLQWEKGSLWYSNNHKVCVDTGGFYLGSWVLLNLDTHEEIIIELDGNDKMCF